MNNCIRIFVTCASVLTATGCVTLPPALDFVPQELRPAGTKLHAELKTITVSIASEDKRLGKTQVGFGGNRYELAYTCSGIPSRTPLRNRSSALRSSTTSPTGR